MPIEIHDVSVSASGASGQSYDIAATVFLPPPASLSSGPDVLVLFPGACYSRGYFNLPVPGASEAMFHAGRGNLVVTVDPLGVGESSSAEGATAADGIAALHDAVTQIAAGLSAGTLIAGLGPVAFGVLVGAGQSLGGHLLRATQAAHQTFAGIALLGSAVTGTRFPLPDGTTTAATEEFDFPYAFHWGQVPAVDVSATPTNLTDLAGVDVAIGLPARTADASWASRTIPAYVGEITATAGAEAAQITSQVLIAVGERDVTGPVAEEAAAFTSAAEVDTFVLPESAHMHNFAATAEQLWKRLDLFVAHASTYDRRVQSTEFVAAMIKAAQEEGEDSVWSEGKDS